jgi:hypothetical protein
MHIVWVTVWAFSKDLFFKKFRRFIIHPTVKNIYSPKEL